MKNQTDILLKEKKTSEVLQVCVRSASESAQKPDGKCSIPHTRKHDNVMMCMAAQTALSAAWLLPSLIPQHQAWLQASLTAGAIISELWNNAVVTHGKISFALPRMLYFLDNKKKKKKYTKLHEKTTVQQKIDGLCGLYRMH